MLARAATRRAQLQEFFYARRSIEQSPFLSLRKNRSRWIGDSRTTSVRKSNLPQQVATRKETRQLASAADLYPTASEPVPFEGLHLSQYGQSNILGSTSTSERTNLPPSLVRPFDPENPIIINQSVITAPPTLTWRKGPGGDPGELHQNLYACLRVGRMQRAAIVVRRLAELYQPNAPELVDAHNHYLDALVQELERTRSTSVFDEIRGWHEYEMRLRHVPADGTTFSLLIRAAFVVLEGSRLDRTLRTYLELAEAAGPEVVGDIVAYGEFTSAEWKTLVRLRPDYFEEESEDASAEAEAMPAPDDSAPSNAAPLPEIKSVQQKGLGLKSVQRSLALFSDKDSVRSQDDVPSTDEEKREGYMMMRELRLEEDAVVAAVERWRQEDEQLKSKGVNSLLQSRTLGGLLWTWYAALLPCIKEELKLVHEALNAVDTHYREERLIYGPYMETLDAKRLTATTIVSVTSAIGLLGVGHGMKFSKAVTSVGQQLEKESLMKKGKISIESNRSRRARFHLRQKNSFKSPDVAPPSSEGQGQVIERCLQDEYHERWPLSGKLKLSSFLISKFIETAKIPVTRRHPRTGEQITQLQPAFSHTQVYRLGRKLGMIFTHPDLGLKLAREPVRGALAKRLPMIVKPKPWTDVTDGGYYRYPVRVVRAKDSDDTQRFYVHAAVEKGDMKDVFAGLDVLGKTPWKINKDVLRVMSEAWNSGETIGKIPPDQPDMPIPREPALSEGLLARRAWQKQRKKIEDAKCANHSQRCYWNFQLEVARAFRDETFYFPHNLDFRGRAYPIPPYLNHMAADNARGLLIFAEGKELGEVGLRWLKIHLANLYGYDKASLQEREDFATANIENIRDSASNPLTGRRWWLKAEDPWQCLGACFELKNALDLPDPTRYVSHIPVHQDGTCNGLQHYAALGGDVAGARQVNLEPGSRPSDVYSAVADIVQNAVSIDAAKGLPVAVMLDGKITRKVVKQTVMTNVYGVTYMGAREQVRRQLREILPNLLDMPDMNFGILSTYVARKIFMAMSSMFNGATHIQHWLADCADRISAALMPEQIEKIRKVKLGLEQMDMSKYKRVRKRSKKDFSEHARFKSPVIWTTPLRMPVVQPYRACKGRIVVTTLQAVAITEPHIYDPISRRKQLQAFAPNFIHSLDATHMMLSALACDKLGMSFASVHDSFWTHPADVPKLNEVLRDAFVQMHSDDIMNRLAAEFRTRYKGCMYRATVPKNSELGEKIMALRESKKRTNLFSAGEITRSEIDDLLEETERLRLLGSEDPELQQQGREMMTAARLFEEAADPSMLNSVAARERPFQSTKDETHGGEADQVESGGKEALEAGSESESAPGDDSFLEDESADEDQESEDAEKSPRKRKPQDYRRVYLWLPLTFLPLPKRGTFDVSRLSKSQYFFS